MRVGDGCYARELFLCTYEGWQVDALLFLHCNVIVALETMPRRGVRHTFREDPFFQGPPHSYLSLAPLSLQRTAVAVVVAVVLVVDIRYMIRYRNLNARVWYIHLPSKIPRSLLETRQQHILRIRRFRSVFYSMLKSLLFRVEAKRERRKYKAHERRETIVRVDDAQFWVLSFN